MKFYHTYATTYHHGKEIGTTVGKMLTDQKVDTEVYNITWDNISEMYQKLGLECSFNVWNLKKGRRVSFFTENIIPRKHERDVKEWKEKDLDIVVKITYSEWKPSIEQVLKWHDTEKAIAYLKEKGLNF